MLLQRSVGWTKEIGSSFDADSPDSVLSFIRGGGMILAPLYSSQKRFLDARYASDEGAITYRHLHAVVPSEEFEGATTLMGRGDSQAYSHLCNAIWDVYVERLRETESLHPSAYEFPDLVQGSFANAVALSEYARRVRRKDKQPGEGGIVSFYEVSLSIKAMKRAVETICAIDASRGDAETLVDMKFNGVGDRISSDMLHATMDNEATSNARKQHLASNWYSFQLSQSLDFVSRCVFSVEGASAVSMGRDLVNAEVFDGRLRTSMEVSGGILRANYYEENEPRFLDNRYVEGTFGAALCAQLLEDVQDEAPWKQCTNPECGRYFKYKRSNKSTGQRKREGSKFCSDRCSCIVSNKLYDAENQAIERAVRRGLNIAEARKYVESQMEDLVDSADLPKARERWRSKIAASLKDGFEKKQ